MSLASFSVARFWRCRVTIKSLYTRNILMVICLYPWSAKTGNWHYYVLLFCHLVQGDPSFPSCLLWLWARHLPQLRSGRQRAAAAPDLPSFSLTYLEHWEDDGSVSVYLRSCMMMERGCWIPDWLLLTCSSRSRPQCCLTVSECSDTNIEDPPLNQANKYLRWRGGGWGCRLLLLGQPPDQLDHRPCLLLCRK